MMCKIVVVELSGVKFDLKRNNRLQNCTNHLQRSRTSRPLSFIKQNFEDEYQFDEARPRSTFLRNALAPAAVLASLLIT